jgi:hypothetical protein
MTRGSSRARWVLSIGVIVGSAMVFAAALRADRGGAWRIFLANLLFWSGLAAGAGALAALFELTGAEWPGRIRKVAEGATGLLPAVCVFLVLLLAGLRSIFGGADARGLAALRDAIAIAVFYAVCVSFVRSSPRSAIRAAAVVLVFTAAMSLVAIDLVMRFDPEWTSTLFPAYFAVAALYGAIAAVTIAASMASIDGRPVLDAERAGEIGRLLLGMSLVWAYLFWSQYFVIWYGNLPHEFSFVVDRTRGGWRVIAAAVIVCCFAAPFLLTVVRRTRRLVVLASWFALGGLWLERLLLVFPPHRWHAYDAAVAVAVALGFAALFAHLRARTVSV